MDTQRRSLITYLRSFAWIMGFCAMLPFDVLAGESIWPWMGLRDAAFLDAIAILLPLMGAVVFMLLSFSRMSKLNLCLFVLTVFGLGWIVNWWAQQIPHPLPVFEHLTDGLPGLFSRSLWLLLLGTSAIGAGVLLVSKRNTPEVGISLRAGRTRAGRWLVLAGVSLVVIFYFIDYRGHNPLVDLLVRMVQLLTALHDIQGLALFSGHVLSIGPLLLAVASVFKSFQKVPGRNMAFFSFCSGFIPALCLLVGVRDLSINPVTALVHIRSAGLILAVTLGASLSLAALFDSLWFDTPWLGGKMTKLDHLFACAGDSTMDHVRFFRELFKPMNPIVRLFAKHRLSMWVAAAGSSENSEKNDLEKVVDLLEQVQLEETAMLCRGNLPEPEAKQDKRKGPRCMVAWWLRGHWMTMAGLCFVALLGLVSFYSMWRPKLQICPNLDDANVVDNGLANEVFSHLIPDVILDMERYGKLRRTVPLFMLKNALLKLNAQAPGVYSKALSLLETASEGRYMFHSLRRVRDGLNRLLLKNHIPYYVSSRMLPRRDAPDLFYLLSYKISFCSMYVDTNTGQKFSVLYLHRVDGLNIMESYMGVAEEEEEFVTVIIDRLSSFMQEQVLTIVDRSDLVGKIVSDCISVLGQGPGDLSKGVEGSLGKNLLQGLTRHELHHRWIGLEPEPPTEIWAFLLEYSNSFARAVTSEVGAFLGEMIYCPSYARLRLALMVDALGRPEGRKGVYGRARVFVLHKVLGVDVFSGQRPTRSWLAMAAERLEAIDDDSLTLRIDKAHIDLFGVPVPRFELESSVYTKGVDNDGT